MGLRSRRGRVGGGGCSALGRGSRPHSGHQQIRACESRQMRTHESRQLRTLAGVSAQGLKPPFSRRTRQRQEVEAGQPDHHFSLVQLEQRRDVDECLICARCFHDQAHDIGQVVLNCLNESQTPAPLLFSHLGILRVGRAQHDLGGVLVPLALPLAVDARCDGRQCGNEVRHLICANYCGTRVRSPQMNMRARSSTVGMTREPAFTDEALASTTTVDADPRIVIGVLSVIGIPRRHDRTVAVRSPRRMDLGRSGREGCRQPLQKGLEFGPSDYSETAISLVCSSSSHEYAASRRCFARKYGSMASVGF